jgi:hypothetical protein
VSHDRQDIRDKKGGGGPLEPEGNLMRRPVTARTPIAAVLARLSYANVAATLALFVALGGTAAAATLARDSVGAPQIRTDAVRSPEIQADAVRSPEIRADAVRSSEIQADAVRSSEIRDESILLADIAPGARTALDAPRVRLAEDVEADVPTCSGPLTACPNLLSVVLPSDNWLVQAKFTMRNNGNPQTLGTVCALVQSDTTVLDDVLMESLDVRFRTGSSEAAALTDVVTGVPDDTRVALRCIEGSSEHLVVDDIKITALEVGTVTG